MTENAVLRSPYLVIDEFMAPSVAHEMRSAIEAHLGRPYEHSPQTHTDWDYWFVPGLYTYLRAVPDRIIGTELAERFHDHLFEWSTSTLGLGSGRSSYLSLYVDGCRQNQHNDSSNGRFGFVYSLTKNDRKTSGGETLIWHEDDYLDTKMRRPCAGADFFDAIEPRFNRLLVFDDRMPHAVQLVEGNMDPLEGRIVIHGHIAEVGPIVSGSLPPAVVAEITNRLAADYAAGLGGALMLFHGPATIRFTVTPDGMVTDSRLILDRVRRLRGQGPSAQQMLAELVDRVAHLRFPPSPEETVVTLPFGFG